MWGTSSPDDKLTGDLRNVIAGTQIGGRQLDRLMAGELSPSELLQQCRRTASHSIRPVGVCLLGWSGQQCCGAVMRAFDPKPTYTGPKSRSAAVSSHIVDVLSFRL